MIQVFDVEQNTDEWKQCRLGIPTASMFATVMAAGKGGGGSKTRTTYMLKLAGERLTGEPADFFVNHHMERGHEMEPDAIAKYEFLFDADLETVGFIKNGRAGCSPDRLSGDSGLVQVKTALPHIQIERLLCGELPSAAKAQVQGEMWIAEREWSDYVSYWPKLPLFCVRVHRDETYIKKLAGEVERFNDELEALVDRIGGVDLEGKLRASLA